MILREWGIGFIKKKNKMKNLHKPNNPIYLVERRGGEGLGANFRKEIGTISKPYRF